MINQGKKYKSKYTNKVYIIKTTDNVFSVLYSVDKYKYEFTLYNERILEKFTLVE